MHRCLILLALLALSCAAWLPAVAQTPAQQPPLRVAISEVPPFVVREDDGRWRGISIDLWQQVADALGREVEWRPMPFQQVLSSLEAGEVDVAVGALTMTAEREERFDFTHPFFQTGLAIGVPAAGQGSTWGVVKGLFSWQFVSVVLALSALLLAIGAVVWRLERRRNAAQFGGSAAQGIGEGFWWAAVTMTTVGYGDRAPVTAAGRAVAVVWMFAGLIMVSGFTAAVTSALTVGSLQGGITGPQDLRRAHVATVAGTASARWLELERIRATAYPDLRQAMLAVQTGEAEAIVYDQPILQYRNAELPGGRLRLLGGTFEQQAYAFALASGSALREPVNREILRLTLDEGWRDLKRRYLGDDTP